MSVTQFLIALLLPPVSVFMNRGFGFSFLLNVVLTLAAWLPGAIHALFVASSSSHQPVTA